MPTYPSIVPLPSTWTLSNGIVEHQPCHAQVGPIGMVSEPTGPLAATNWTTALVTWMLTLRK